MANTAGQPLTRDDCDTAGMAWNDNANVCGEKAEVSATPGASEETNPNGSTVLINIDKASQKMAVFLDDVQLYEWPVSTGLSGYTTPSGTYTARSMNEIWYSRQWDDAPMPHAVFFTKDGHAIHGTHEVKRLGKPASHGCVRLSPQNAATLYALVAKTGLKNTQVLLAGLTPGGEGKVASSKRPKSSRAVQKLLRRLLSPAAKTRWPFQAAIWRSITRLILSSCRRISRAVGEGSRCGLCANHKVSP